MSSGWTAKRFWTSTTTERTPDGWQVKLDDRVLKTPGKLALTLPSETLATAIATEWAGIDGVINPLTLPFTRLANTALEKVAPLRAEVIDEIAAYGASDLLCYRASEPVELLARQAALWDPLLIWLARQFNAPLIVTTGVVPVEQPAASLIKLRAEISGISAFGLTALYEMTAISGSLVIALAARGGHDAEALWQAARLDEDWQAQIWGVDDEAATAAQRKKADFMSALQFLQML